MRAHKSDPTIRPRPKQGQITLDAFVSHIYLPSIRIRKRSWQLDERISRLHLSPVFGHRALQSIRREDVEKWMGNLRQKGLAPASCNRFLAVFKSICVFAAKRGFLNIANLPCAGIAAFRIHAQKERYLSLHEAQCLMERLEKSECMEAICLRLLLLTGARKNEILKARWENIDFERHLLTVPLSKSGKPRHIVLSDSAMAVIRSIPKKNGTPWLFPGRAGDKPLSDLYLFWNRLRHDLGIADVRIHDLRHTFASFLVNAGHSLYEAQQLLGHTDPRTTMRYAHLGQESLRAAAATVEMNFKKNELRQNSQKMIFGQPPCRAPHQKPFAQLLAAMLTGHMSGRKQIYSISQLKLCQFQTYGLVLRGHGPRKGDAASVSQTSWQRLRQADPPAIADGRGLVNFISKPP